MRQGVIPDEWKISRVTPLPKSYPPTSVENDVRPISITNTIAKSAEKFLSRWFDDFFEKHLDRNQFGSTASRSTTHALIKITHEIFKASEDSNNFIRLLFVDFSKAFDLIDHNILLQKFTDYDFPPHLTVWSLAFLQNRQQFVKIGNHQSELQVTNAGTPQGTISGPNDFKLLINDLSFDLDYAKYVDDTTVLSVSSNPTDNSLQLAANHLVNWTAHNHMIVNGSKTKEMLIHFGSLDNNLIPPITINSASTERVVTFKLLGVISSDLSWVHM